MQLLSTVSLFHVLYLNEQNGRTKPRAYSMRPWLSRFLWMDMDLHSSALCQVIHNTILSFKLLHRTNSISFAISMQKKFFSSSVFILYQKKQLIKFLKSLSKLFLFVKQTFVLSYTTLNKAGW